MKKIWDAVMTKYHKKYLQQLELSANIKAYIQYKVLNKTQ